jgi:hypothetical protein
VRAHQARSAKCGWQRPRPCRPMPMELLHGLWGRMIPPLGHATFGRNSGVVDDAQCRNKHKPGPKVASAVDGSASDRTRSGLVTNSTCQGHPASVATSRMIPFKRPQLDTGLSSHQQQFATAHCAAIRPSVTNLSNFAFSGGLTPLSATQWNWRVCHGGKELLFPLRHVDPGAIYRG